MTVGMADPVGLSIIIRSEMFYSAEYFATVSSVCLGHQRSKSHERILSGGNYKTNYAASKVFLGIL